MYMEHAALLTRATSATSAASTASTAAAATACCYSRDGGCNRIVAAPQSTALAEIFTTGAFAYQLCWLGL